MMRARKFFTSPFGTRSSESRRHDGAFKLGDKKLAWSGVWVAAVEAEH